MRLSILALAILVVCCLLAATPVGAQQPTGSVTGVVKAARDLHPVAGAEVSVSRGARRGGLGRPLGSVRTGGDGRFELSGVPLRASLVVLVKAHGYAWEGRFLNLGAERSGLEFLMRPGRHARGRVLDRRDGQGIPGARVGTTLQQVTTDEQGAFALEGLPTAGEDLELAASAPGYVPKQLTMKPGAEPLEVDFVLEPGHVLPVVVLDEQHNPVEGATVRARLPFSTAYSALERAEFSALSDTLGQAVIRGLPAGVPVAPVASFGELLEAQGPVCLPLPAPADEGSLDFVCILRLTTGRQASVLVQDGHGRPLSGADVRLLPLVEPLLAFGGGDDHDRTRGPIRAARTDPAGSVSFDLLPVGLLTCEVRAEGFGTRLTVLRPSPPGQNAGSVVRLDPDPTPTPPAVPWQSGLDAAWAEADRRGLPVHLCMSMDGERANDWMASHHFRDPEIIRVLGELPVVLTNVFGRGGVATPEGVEHDEGDGICTRYGGVPCASHQQGEPYCVENFIGSGVAFQVPRQIFVTTAGEVLMHRVYYLSQRDLVRMTIAALRQARPERARELARARLQPLWHALVARDSAERERAGQDLVALVNSGDEYAIALLGDLRPLGVAAHERLRILEKLLPETLRFADAALAPFLQDPDPVLRRAALRKLSGHSEEGVILRAALPLLGDPDPGVSHAAFRLLPIDHSGHRILVEDVLEGDRWRILEALLAMLPAVSLPGVQQVLAEMEHAGRPRVLRALAARADDRAALELVVAAANAPDETALPALAALRYRARENLPTSEAAQLVRAHAVAPEALLREEAAHLAAAFGLSARLEAVARLLEDPVPEVRVAAALGLLRCGLPRRAAPVLAEWLADPLLGSTIARALEDRYGRERPTGPLGWRAWLVEQGWLTDDEEVDSSADPGGS